MINLHLVSSCTQQSIKILPPLYFDFPPEFISSPYNNYIIMDLLTDCCLDLTTFLNSSNIATHFSISLCVSISMRSSEPICCMVTPVVTLSMHGKCLGLACITSDLVIRITAKFLSLKIINEHTYMLQVKLHWKDLYCLYRQRPVKRSLLTLYQISD